MYPKKFSSRNATAFLFCHFDLNTRNCICETWRVLFTWLDVMLSYVFNHGKNAVIVHHCCLYVAKLSTLFSQSVSVCWFVFLQCFCNMCLIYSISTAYRCPVSLAMMAAWLVFVFTPVASRYQQYTCTADLFTYFQFFLDC